jgi:hypothetical protein
LLWAAYIASGLTQKEFGETIEIRTPSFLSHILYGDRRPGRQIADACKRRFKIDPSTWDLAPTRPFSTPGATRTADAAIASRPTGTDR